MTKVLGTTAIVLVLFGQAALSQTAPTAALDIKCVPPSNPSIGQLRDAVECLQNAILKLSTQPPSTPNPTDPKAVHFGDEVDLRFAEMKWCIARPDPGNPVVMVIQCDPGAPGSGQTKITIDKHQ